MRVQTDPVEAVAEAAESPAPAQAQTANEGESEVTAREADGVKKDISKKAAEAKASAKVLKKPARA